jgi:excisionase family DNA binding protein
MQTDIELDRFFTIPEVCKILGFERSTVYDRVKQGRLAAVRLDGRVRIPREEVKRYLSTATPVAAA